MTFFIGVSPRQGHVECARARPCGGRRSRRSARERAGARGRTRRRAGQGGAASSWPGLCEVAELLGRAPMTPAVHPGSRGEGGPLATRLAASEEPAQGLEIVGRTFDLKTLRVHFDVEVSEGQNVQIGRADDGTSATNQHTEYRLVVDKKH